MESPWHRDEKLDASNSSRGQSVNLVPEAMGETRQNQLSEDTARARPPAVHVLLPYSCVLWVPLLEEPSSAYGNTVGVTIWKSQRPHSRQPVDKHPDFLNVVFFVSHLVPRRLALSASFLVVYSLSTSDSR